MTFSLDLEDSFVEQYRGQLETGSLRVSIEGASLQGTNVVLSDHATIEVLDGEHAEPDDDDRMVECLINTYDSMPMEGDEEEGEEIECTAMVRGHMVGLYSIDLPEILLLERAVEIQAGTLRLSIVGASIEDETIELDDDVEITVVETQRHNLRRA